MVDFGRFLFWIRIGIPSVGFGCVALCGLSEEQVQGLALCSAQARKSAGNQADQARPGSQPAGRPASQTYRRARGQADGQGRLQAKVCVSVVEGHPTAPPAKAGRGSGHSGMTGKTGKEGGRRPLCLPARLRACVRAAAGQSAYPLSLLLDLPKILATKSLECECCNRSQSRSPRLAPICAKYRTFWLQVGVELAF